MPRLTRCARALAVAVITVAAVVAVLAMPLTAIATNGGVGGP